jgi:hypothetical protein
LTVLEREEEFIRLGEAIAMELEFATLQRFRPRIAGAVFGDAWWIWVDAAACSSVKISFLYYLPGIFASFATLMSNW